MLDVIFGRENVPEELKPRVILNAKAYFLKYKKPEWFADNFVQEFLREVEKASVIEGEVLRDYKDRVIPASVISTGCKTLCCIRFAPENIYQGSLLGDNCLPFLVRMAEENDITILFEHYADFTKEDIAKGLIRCRGIVVNQRGYDDAFSEWSASTREDDFEERFYNCGL